MTFKRPRWLIAKIQTGIKAAEVDMKLLRKTDDKVDTVHACNTPIVKKAVFGSQLIER